MSEERTLLPEESEALDWWVATIRCDFCYRSARRCDAHDWEEAAINGHGALVACSAWPCQTQWNGEVATHREEGRRVE